MRLKFLMGAAVVAGTASAWAQSSATVFGVVDLAARAVSNDETQYQLASGGNQTSRLGIRGTEALWGDLSAGFWLEGELTPDNGNSNGFDWRRRSTVSVISKAFGELRVGRDKVPTLYDWEDYDPFRDAGIGRSTRLSVASGIVPSDGAYSTFSRADNEVSYILPSGLGGLFGQVSVAAGEGRPGNKYLGGRIGYRAGAVAASASYGKTEVTSADDAEIWNIGAAYDFQVVRLMGFYSSLDIGASSQSNWLLGVTAPIAGFELRASYQSMEGDGALSGQEATMWAIGAVYPLSKRTALYATYSSIDNDDTRFSVASGSTLTRGNDSSGYEFGLRHSF
jgi:predicted porin